MNIEDICTVANDFWVRQSTTNRPIDDPLVASLVREHSLRCSPCARSAEAARIVRGGLRAAGAGRRKQSGWKDRLLARLSYALAQGAAAGELNNKQPEVSN